MSRQLHTNVRAIYHAGVFTLLEPVALPDGAQVQLDVRLTEPAKAQYKPPPVHPNTFVSATTLDALTGVVATGGDALGDTEALYDSERD